jgi:hypothetical protein
VRVLLPLPDRDFDVTEVAAADDTPAFAAADRNYLAGRRLPVCPSLLRPAQRLSHF